MEEPKAEIEWPTVLIAGYVCEYPAHPERAGGKRWCRNTATKWRAGGAAALLDPIDGRQIGFLCDEHYRQMTGGELVAGGFEWLKDVAV